MFFYGFILPKNKGTVSSHKKLSVSSERYETSSSVPSIKTLFLDWKHSIFASEHGLKANTIGILIEALHTKLLLKRGLRKPTILFALIRV
jgi:hypothetical protein